MSAIYVIRPLGGVLILAPVKTNSHITFARAKGTVTMARAKSAITFKREGMQKGT